MTGLVFAAFTAFAWSGFDIVRKAITRHVDPAAVVLLVTGPQAIFFGVRWMIDGAPLPDSTWVVPLVASTGLNLAANLLFLAALHRSDIARVIPLLSLSPVASALTGLVVLGEVITTAQWIGIAAIVGGCVLASPGRGPRRTWGRDPGTWRAVLVAVCWGITPAFDKLGVQAAGLDLQAATPALLIFVIVWLRLDARQRRLTGARTAPVATLATIALGPLAMGLQLYTLALVPVAVLESTKRAIGMALSLLVGRTLFGETVRLTQVAGVIAIAAGLPLVLGS